MKKTIILRVLITFLLISSVFSAKASKSVIKGVNEKFIKLYGEILEDGKFFLEIKVDKWNSDFKTQSLTIYSEPSHEIVFFHQGDINGLAEDIYIESLPNSDDWLSVEMIPESDSSAKSEAAIFPEDIASFDVGLGFYADSSAKITGCFASGTCGNTPVTGKWCDPCVFTLCCVSHPPYIVCGWHYCL